VGNGHAVLVRIENHFDCLFLNERRRIPGSDLLKVVARVADEISVLRTMKR